MWRPGWVSGWHGACGSLHRLPLGALLDFWGTAPFSWSPHIPSNPSTSLEPPSFLRKHSIPLGALCPAGAPQSHPKSPVPWKPPGSSEGRSGAVRPTSCADRLSAPDAQLGLCLRAGGPSGVKVMLVWTRTSSGRLEAQLTDSGEGLAVGGERRGHSRVSAVAGEGIAGPFTKWEDQEKPP